MLENRGAGYTRTGGEGLKLGPVDLDVAVKVDRGPGM